MMAPTANQSAAKVGIIALVVFGVIALLFVLRVAVVFQKTHNLWDVLWCTVYLFQDEGEYTEGYSDRGFMKVSIGDPMSKVLEKLGPPLEISWMTPDGQWHRWKDEDGGWPEQRRRINEKVAASESQTPQSPENESVEAWYFSRGGANQNYWFRRLSFDARGKVSNKDGHYFAD